MTNDNIPNNSDSISLLQEIAHNSSMQVALQKRNLFWSKISSALMLLTFVLVLGALVFAYPILSQLSHSANDLLLQLSVLLDDISEITAQLQQLDLETSMSEISTLVTESTDKISALDIDTLNTAIKDLSAAVAPFASLFGR